MEIHPGYFKSFPLLCQCLTPPLAFCFVVEWHSRASDLGRAIRKGHSSCCPGDGITVQNHNAKTQSKGPESVHTLQSGTR